MIDIIWLGNNTMENPEIKDAVFSKVPENPKEINRAIKKSLENESTNYLLIWHEKFGIPDLDKIFNIIKTPGDVWHSGLLLGTKGKPFLLNFIAPTWMFNKDPDKIQRITSFRMHFFGTLFKKGVFKHLGLFDENFETLEGAALDMGLRLIKGGAFIIFEPRILEGITPLPQTRVKKLTIHDEVRMLQKHFSKQQLIWALVRSISYGYPKKEVFKELKKVLKTRGTPEQPVWERHLPDNFELPDKNVKVSVIIPTLKRHKYLKNVLDAMREQTIKPFEIIVIDEEKFPEFYSQFKDLPLTVLTGSNIGQSTARNLGLEIARGNYIMFLDDDIDDIPTNFIENHLRYLHYFRTDASCGTVRERGIDISIHRFKKIVRLSDVFPTNNVMLKSACLNKIDLFDTKFDRGMQEDHDFGIRIYIAGHLMGINPFVEVFHHRAPRGGLRENKARKVTFSSARTSIFRFNILHKSSFYLMLKYYNDFQIKEEILLNIRGFFIVKGGLLKKILKILVATFLLPVLCFRLVRNYNEAKRMLK